jgi:hypothetical protein
VLRALGGNVTSNDEARLPSARGGRYRRTGRNDRDSEPETPAAPAPTRQFDAASARAAVAKAAASVSYCPRKGNDPRGSANATVTFGPSGKVTGATVGAPFAGKPIGACIEGRLRQATISAYDGGSKSVPTRVRVP